MKNQRNKKFVLLFVSLILLCYLPISSDLYSYNRRSVVVENEDSKPVSIKNTYVKQTIYVEGHISNLGIYFYAPSGQLYDEAIINIIVKQDNLEIKDSIKAKDLRTLSPYKQVDSINGIEEDERDEMYYYFNKGLSKLEKGTAEIIIYSDNLPEGTDIFCMASSTLVSGLPSAYSNDNNLGYPLVLEYDVFLYNNHFIYETLLLILLFICIIATSFLLTYKNELIEKHQKLSYILSMITIILVVSIKNPYASFFGEPKSEAVYEFWYKAHYYGFFKSLMSLMSGEALAWLERIFMSIADFISPTKYVFVVAQLIELIWIAFVCSMPCLNYFKKYFNIEIRLLISIFIGCFLFFDNQYYFWSCSYWSLVFFIYFTMLPLDKLKAWQYWFGIILSIILCVSRIYNIMLIPVAFVLLLVFRKEKNKRFNLYCLIVIISSIFEVCYSLLSSDNLANGSLNISLSTLINIIKNTIYYQVQMIISFFTGNEYSQGFALNVFGLCFILYFMYQFIKRIKDKDKNGACFFGCLGFISLCSIAINVYVSGNHYEVSFPLNYSTLFDVTKTIYQRADLHFSYSYLCIFFMIIGSIYYKKESIKLIYIDNYLFNNGVLICSLFLTVAASVSAEPRQDYDSIVVSWKDIYKVTESNKYFASVNVWYNTTKISLENGSDEYVYGIKEDGELYEWNYGSDQYQLYKPYHEALVGEVSNVSNKEVVSITARKSLINFDVIYYAILKDSSGNVLAKVKQAQSEYRYWLDFILDEPIKDVYSISFELEDGNQAYIQNGLQVGYLK